MFIVLNRKLLSVKKVLFGLGIFFLVIIFGLASYVLINNLKFHESYVPKGIKVEGILFGGLSKEEARFKLLEMSKSTVRWPKDPTYELGYFTEGKEGRILSIEQTLAKLHKAPINSDVRPIYNNILTLNNVNDFQQIKFGKGTDKEFHFLTDIELKELKTVCNQLLNTVIYPGETFSLTDYWLSTYYKTANFDSRVSQIVARSLYNTAKKAKLEIIEAWITPQPKLGSLSDDNLEFLPGKDLKFRNNSSSAMLIRGEVNQESLKLWLLGS